MRLSLQDALLGTEDNPTHSTPRDLVRQMLDVGGLTVHFQPVVDQSDNVVGIEALSRLRRVDGETVPPAQFLDSIEGTELMVRLDLMAFESSCLAAAVLAKAKPFATPFVSVNFSSTSLAHPDLCGAIATLLERHEVRPNQMYAEVTERIVTDSGIEGVDSLVETGVGIALDNFGTGFASLESLHSWPLSMIKVDRQFTSALDGTGASRAMALTVVQMATSIGVPVVAEGVETLTQRRYAHSHGLDLMQGWLHSQAMPLPKLVSDFL